MKLRLGRSVAFAVLLPLLLQVQGCGDSDSVQYVSVSLKKDELFQYTTAAGGDEEGARISTQASHFSISEIRRDASTGFVAVYVYQPEAGFVGSDFAELEISTGSDGASPNDVQRVVLRFLIRE